MSSHTFTVNSDDYFPAYYLENESANVKVPKNREENRKLKYGHVEDDNTEIAYLNFPMLRASLIFTFLSFTCFTAAIVSALRSDYKPLNEDELTDDSIIIHYGGRLFRCKTFLKFPLDGLLSILNLFEINVWGNVIFRIATCLTISVRIFHSILFRNLLSNYHWKNSAASLSRWFYDLIPMLTGVETFSLALFSIVTMHTDFKEINHFCKSSFAVSAMVNMFLISSFTFVVALFSGKCTDVLLSFFRCTATAVFGYFAPQYFQFHIGWTATSLCHSYIPYNYAIMEYCILASYALFNILVLFDLRGLQFICYPRSSSGECEPLEPSNFEHGSKYEHCRAFEFNQRRLINKKI